MLFFGIGFFVGVGYGSKIVSFQFCVEYVYKLFLIVIGWYLYYKSKNYIVVCGGLCEGLKMGIKIGVWIMVVFFIEYMFDEYCGIVDLFNIVMFMVICVGVFSFWSMFF